MKLASSIEIILLFVALFVPGPGADAATVTGHITLDNGKPATGYTVIVRSTDYISPIPSGTAVTDDLGRYVVLVDTDRSPRIFAGSQPSPLPPDEHFSVTVRIGNGLYLKPSTRAVVVTPTRQASDVDFVVTIGPKITLRVHDAITGKPVPGISVKNNWDRMGTPFSAMGQPIPVLGITDARGIAVFRVRSLYMELTLSSPEGKMSTIQPAAGYDSYKEIRLKKLEDVTWDVKIYSHPPAANALWHGTVLEPNGRPVAGATVHILRRPPDATLVIDQFGHYAVGKPPFESQETTTQTDRRGCFAVGLPPNKSNGYDKHEFEDVVVLAERGHQTALMLPTVDAVWAGMLLRLSNAPAARYTGMVTDAQGHLEARVPVSCESFLSAADFSLTRAARPRGVTDAAGRFEIINLPVGRYRVRFGGGSFGETTIPPTAAGSSDPKNWPLLAAGQHEDLGRIVVPLASQSLAGQVVTDTGQRVPEGVLITVTGKYTNQAALLDSSSHFRVSYLVAEPLQLTVYKDATNSPTDVVVRIPVQAGQKDLRVVVPADAFPPHSSVPPTPPAGSSHG